MAYLLPPELVWGCLPSPLLLSRGLGMEETCQPGLVAHSTRSLAPDYSFQTQFVALPRAAASPEHVTRLFPPPYPPTLGAWTMQQAASQDLQLPSELGPARSLLGLRLCSVEPAQPGPGSWITRLPLASVFRPWRDSFLVSPVVLTPMTVNLARLAVHVGTVLRRPHSLSRHGLTSMCEALYFCVT